MSASSKSSGWPPHSAPPCIQSCYTYPFCKSGERPYYLGAHSFDGLRYGTAGNPERVEVPVNHGVVSHEHLQQAHLSETGEVGEPRLSAANNFKIVHFVLISDVRHNFDVY